MCAVPSMAVSCSSLISRYPSMLLRYFLTDFEVVPVTPIITGITFFFTFHVCCIYNVFVVVAAAAVYRNCGLPLSTFQIIWNSNGTVQLRHLKWVLSKPLRNPKSHITSSGSEICRLGSLEPCYTDQTPLACIRCVFLGY